MLSLPFIFLPSFSSFVMSSPSFAPGNVDHQEQSFPASFSFVNREEALWALQALNAFAEEAGDHQQKDCFFLFLDAFQAFCLSL